jgi:hypothetical protein
MTLEACMMGTEQPPAEVLAKVNGAPADASCPMTHAHQDP